MYTFLHLVMTEEQYLNAYIYVMGMVPAQYRDISTCTILQPILQLGQPCILWLFDVPLDYY